MIYLLDSDVYFMEGVTARSMEGKGPLGAVKHVLGHKESRREVTSNLHLFGVG